jgi:hypothetical protein
MFFLFCRAFVHLYLDICDMLNIIYMHMDYLAALNMRGEPIRGEHWIVVDLERTAIVTKILIDW